MTKVNEFNIEDVLLAFQNEYDESLGILNIWNHRIVH